VSHGVPQRLIALVGMLVIVWIAMAQASRPESWNWLGRLTGETPAPVPPGDSELREIRPGSGRPPGLDAAALAGVRDDGYFRPDEQSAWFSIWRVLRDTPADQLRGLSLGEVSYLQIYRQTDELRGRVVDLRGTIRRAHRVQAPGNELEIRDYWQFWIFPDVGPREPIVVYALNAPDQLQESMTLEVPAKLTGIVYKRWSYQAAEGLKVAPVVLANHVTTPGAVPSPPIAARRRLPDRPLLIFLGVAAVALVFVAWMFRDSAKRYGSVHRTNSLPTTITLPDIDSAENDLSSGPATGHIDEQGKVEPPRAGVKPQ
jgi:hypothetical protein